jgi:hypothetical protein
MIRFDHIVDNFNGKEKLLFEGELIYENYPVHLRDINKEYFIDTLIQSFQPFLKIQKPIEKDPNFEYFKYKITNTNNFLDTKFLSFHIFYPNSKNYIIIYLGSPYYDDDDVYLYYGTLKRFKEASRKRYREEVEEEEFLQNVLNAMTRLLNTIIKDYTMMSSLVLRNGTGKFIGPAETRVAEFIGANRSIVKDG